MLWCAGFLFPVLSPSFAGKPVINQILSYNYSVVCHQSESSKISYGGSYLLVCARCVGIYLGALLSAIILLFNFLKLKFNLIPLIIFSAPLIFDAVAVRLRIYSYSKTIAFTTGLLCGAIVFIYILDAIEYSLNMENKRKNEL